MLDGLPSMRVLLYIWILGLAATHISLTVLVYRDARNLRRSALKITPLLWGGVAFSVPLAGMLVYWLMNYSTLGLERQPTYREERTGFFEGR